MPPSQFNLSAPDYVILIVEDLDRALRFYVDLLGLQLGHRSGDYAQLDKAPRAWRYIRAARWQKLWACF